jgi:hypothetical protein
MARQLQLQQAQSTTPALQLVWWTGQLFDLAGTYRRQTWQRHAAKGNRLSKPLWSSC